VTARRIADDAVSVIIPSYQCAAYLGRALASVAAQTQAPLETIVVDDGSTDDTEAVARGAGAGVRYLRQDHAGLSTARNRGVTEARGRFLAFLDADDVWLPSKLERQMARLREEPGLDGTFGHVEEFHSEDLTPEQRRGVRIRPGRHPGPLAATLLIRREAFQRVGAFRPAFRVGEFVDWYLRAREAGLVFEMLPDVVLRRRVHTDNMGRRHAAARGDYARILKQSLDRRRATARTRRHDPPGPGDAPD